MNNVADIPYAAAHFDKDGAALDKQRSHGARRHDGRYRRGARVE